MSKGAEHRARHESSVQCHVSLSLSRLPPALVVDTVFPKPVITVRSKPIVTDRF